VIDLEFGPDGLLYVLEYDEAGWFATFNPMTVTNGTINRCDVSTMPATCTVVVNDLVLPGAITFDSKGDLWVVERNVTTPEVRRIGSL
jgi:hypothetical protein